MNNDIPDYSSFFYYNHLPSWVYSLETFRILDVNFAAIEHYGYSKDEFLSLTLKDLHPRQEIPKLVSAHADIDTYEGNRYFGVFTHQKKNGKLIRLEINGHKVDYLGEACVMVVCRDVTEEEQQLKILKESEEALRSSEAKFRTIFEIASLGIIQVDPTNGQIILVNSYYETITGFSIEELLNMSFLELTHPDDREKDWEEFSKAMRGEKNYRNKKRYIKKDGSIVWVRIHLAFIRDNNGEPYRTVAICEDITAQINSEQALIKSEKRFRTLIENSADAIVIIGVDGKPNYVSSSIYKLLGYTEKEALELNLFEIIHPDDKEGIVNKMAEVLQSPGVPIQGYTSRTRHKDGSWRWLEAVLVNMLHDPDINGIVDNFRDITDQKIEEQRLKLLESVITHTNDAILITEAEPLDEPGPRIIYVNEAFTRMTGYSAEEVIGKTPRILQGPKSDKKELARLSRALRNWEPCEITTINYKKNGDEFWIDFSVSPVANEKGWYTHWIAIERDVTEERKLKELNRLSSKMARIGSWEIDVAGNKLFWSDMIYELHEVSPNEFQPDVETAINLYREDFRSKVTEIVNNSIKTGVPFDFEAVLVTLNKNELWVRAIGNAEMVDGKCQRIYGSFQDIHERKEAELRLQSLADNLPGVVFQYVLNPDGSDALRYVTKGAEDIWGYSVEEVVSNNDLVWNQIKAGGNYDEVRDSIMTSIQSKSKWKATWKYVSPNGEVNTHLGYGSPYFLPDGTVIFNSVILDITQEAKNEELLEAATEMAKIGSWELDLVNQESDAMYWSPMTREILEVDEQYNPSLTGGFEFYTEKSKERIQQAVEKLIEEGKTFDEELLITTAHGNEKWIRCIGQSQQVQGKNVRIYGSYQDIHQQKMAEHQKNSLLTTLESSLNEIYIFDSVTFRFIYVNRGALKNIGYSEQEIKALTPLDLKPEFTETYFKKLISPLKTYEKEKTIFFTNHKRKDGSLYPVEVHLQLVKESNNDRFLAIILDITERKKVEEQLINAFKEKNNILESIGDAFFAVDRNWIVTYWNKQAENLLGKERDSIVGKHLWEEYADAIDTKFYHQYHKALESYEIVTFEEYYPTVKKWFEVTAYPSNEGLSIYFKDITLRKEADIRLIEANERFQKVTEATNDAIWDWNIAQGTLHRSSAIDKFLGIETAKSLNEEDFWQDKFHPDDLLEIKNSIQKSLDDPQCNR